MMELEHPIILDLSTLPSDVELVRPVAEALALAASVVLDRLHGAREADPAEVHGSEQPQSAKIRRAPVDASARESYGDPQEATEEGGEAIGVLVARRVLDRIVFSRLPKGTGADYRMRDPNIEQGDLYERLECSAIADGPESTTTRLRRKLAQLARFPGQPGTAVVTNFRTQPVDIRFGRLET